MYMIYFYFTQGEMTQWNFDCDYSRFSGDEYCLFETLKRNNSLQSFSWLRMLDDIGT